MKTTSAFALTIFAIVFCTSCEQQTIEPVMPPASYEGGGPVKGADTKRPTARINVVEISDAVATIDSKIPVAPVQEAPAQSLNSNGKMLVAKKHLQ